MQEKRIISPSLSPVYRLSDQGRWISEIIWLSHRGTEKERVLMSTDAFTVAVNINSTALIKTASSFMLWSIWLCG